MSTLLQQIEQAGIFSWIAGSAYAYPALLWLHLLTFSIWIGLILLTNLPSVGLGLGVPELAKGFRRIKWISFLFTAFFGILLFGAKAGQYSYNPWFWGKILLLLLFGGSTLIFRGNRTKLAAGLSIALLLGAVLASRGPATIRDLMHSMVDPTSEYLFDSVAVISDWRGLTEIAPTTDEDWRQLRNRADVLFKMPELLTAPGRRAARPRDRAENPEVELETPELQGLLQSKRDDFALRADKFRDAVSIVTRAIDAKDKDALSDSLNDMDRACEGCHVRYWYPRDKFAVESAKEDGILE
jgi:hypothetical protein